jgi:hypothetical protein
VTFKKADDLREIVRKTPLDRILVETDAPYLAPQPHRGKRNERAYVALVAARIAEERGVETAVIAQHTTANARRLFCLPSHPMSSSPDLSIIIVNWNVRDLLRALPGVHRTRARQSGRRSHRRGQRLVGWQRGDS